MNPEFNSKFQKKMRTDFNIDPAAGELLNAATMESTPIPANFHRVLFEMFPYPSTFFPESLAQLHGHRPPAEPVLKPHTKPTTPTAFDQTLEADAKRRLAMRSLNKKKFKLENWAYSILQYKLGRSFYTDKRRTKVSRTIVDGLQAIATLFEVDKNLEYVRFANQIDAYGWRITSIDEIRQLGRTHQRVPCSFTERQVHFIIRELEFSGFLEYNYVFDKYKRRRQLLIRYRADRVLQAIRGVTVVRESEAKRAAELKLEGGATPDAGG